MRTTEFNLAGKTCLLVFNNRVLSGMERDGISLQDISADKPVTNAMRLLQMMIESGSRYAAATGAGEYPVLSLDEILDMTGPGDYEAILAAITATLAGERNVDAVPPKNAGGTPAEVSQNG